MSDPADWWKDEPDRDPLEIAILRDKSLRIGLAMDLPIDPTFKDWIITPPSKDDAGSE
jgi:hypothetical protein